ncbi:unnamed protein product, partial [Ceratitis capitata]
MKSVLIHGGLWHVVSEKLLKTEDNANEWEALDEKALATIILSVKALQLIVVAMETRDSLPT